MAYKCPNDPKKRYFNHHCNERQRTPWMKATCNGCRHFKNGKPVKEVKNATNKNR